MKGSGRSEKERESLPAVLALQTCALIWGSQHVVIKDLVESDVAPSALNAARFGIAARLARLTELPDWPKWLFQAFPFLQRFFAL